MTAMNDLLARFLAAFRQRRDAVAAWLGQRAPWLVPAAFGAGLALGALAAARPLG